MNQSGRHIPRSYKQATGKSERSSSELDLRRWSSELSWMSPNSLSLSHALTYLWKHACTHTPSLARHILEAAIHFGGITFTFFWQNEHESHFLCSCEAIVRCSVALVIHVGLYTKWSKRGRTGNKELEMVFLSRKPAHCELIGSSKAKCNLLHSL